MKKLNLFLFKVDSDIYEHLECIYDLCLKIGAEVILELGVRSGESTRMFIEACKELEAKLISIDIADCSYISDYKDWQFIREDDLTVDIAEDIDVLFIDTTHTYKQTIAELNRFGPLVKKGGMIILHDSDMRDVKDAIGDYLDAFSPDSYKRRTYDGTHKLDVLVKMLRVG